MESASDLSSGHEFSLHAQAVAFIASGQNGYFGLYGSAPARVRRFVTADALVEEMGGYTYFGPVALTQPRARAVDAATKANVVWADIDPSDRDDHERDRCLQRTTERLRSLGIVASVVIDSGRGHWVYLKLTKLVASGKVIEFNKRLARYLGGDPSGCDITQLARLPGSRNEKTGRIAEVVEVSGVLYDPAFLDATLPPLPTSERTVAALEIDAADFELVSYPAPPLLTTRAQDYIAARPRRGEGFDRSREEYVVFRQLACQGWADDEIVSFAFRERLPRHREEWQRRSGKWTYTTLAKVRADLDREGIETRPVGGPVLVRGVAYPVGTRASAWLRHRGDATRYRHLDRGEIIWLVRGQTKTEFYDEVVSLHGCHKITAFNALKQLIVAGYVEERRDKRDGRRRLIFLTEKGQAALEFEHHTTWKNTLHTPTLRTLRRGGEIAVGTGGFSWWSVKNPKRRR